MEWSLPKPRLASFDGSLKMAEDLEKLIARFDPITLAEMDGVKLQDRMDTKYVFAGPQLPSVLERMTRSYRLLEIDGVRGSRYRSLYYDTPDLLNYRDHHNRRTFRSKVRFREYLGSGLAFLEVKRKTGRGRTDKARMRVDTIPEQLSEEHRRFIAKAIGEDRPLEAVLWNHFTRYTFVHRDLTERLTMDVGLTFSGPREEHALGDIVVAELKQSRIDRRSPFARIMRSEGIRPAGMSKYCIGMLMMARPVKHNAFKKVLLMLQRLREAA